MASKVKSFFKLIRVRQYYKNALIGLGIFFSENLFNYPLYFPLIIGFCLLCFTSSINYIINDIIDREHDKAHPEKLEKKPLASGELSIRSAIITLIVLVCVILLCLIFLTPDLEFALLLLFMFITGQLYSQLFKNYVFVDILTLSLGYIWRALAGCFLIDQFISAWLILSIYEVALFLVLAKRKGDLSALGNKEDAVKHKKVYDAYSMKLLDHLHILMAGSIFITYSLYLILKFDLFSATSVHLNEYITILTIPIILYILMRYMYLTSTQPEIARNTEKVLQDKGIIIAGVVFGIILSYSFYFDEVITICKNILDFIFSLV
ncbi:MAG: Decaprenyl-phosphate phosphoribosyltransferase [Promethearchaeota archaeon]|nr:MAG: Decaprenyl-phosphate phosphoribosyltransferase [Candidatus Lokiarchaeota archaeon]